MKYQLACDNFAESIQFNSLEKAKKHAEWIVDISISWECVKWDNSLPIYFDRSSMEAFVIYEVPDSISQ